MAVTPNGRHAVSGSAGRTLRVWDLATGKTKTTLQGHTEGVNAVAVTPDGRHAVSGSERLLRLGAVAPRKPESGPLQTHQLLDWFSLVVQFWLAISTESQPRLFPNPVQDHRMKNAALEERLLASIAQRGIEEPLEGVQLQDASILPRSPRR